VEYVLVVCEVRKPKQTVLIGVAFTKENHKPVYKSPNWKGTFVWKTQIHKINDKRVHFQWGFSSTFFFSRVRRSRNPFTTSVEESSDDDEDVQRKKELQHLEEAAREDK